MGSSPLTRGKLPKKVLQTAEMRLIPAHAGKTSGPSYRVIRPWAHPRSRGENPPTQNPPSKPSGSSPLTRGKRPLQGGSAQIVRLIPAHAGKTLPSRCRLGRCCGSSPLTRGKLFRHVVVSVGVVAHPRSRGENSYFAQSFDTQLGSSPLTRGKLWSLWLVADGERLIPAHAGKTGCASRIARRATAHPRSRGENGDSHVFGHFSVGSSPLTRGKLSRRCR